MSCTCQEQPRVTDQPEPLPLTMDGDQQHDAATLGEVDRHG
jgi:hypothetical protein